MEEHGFSSKTKVDPEGLTDGEHQLTMLLTDDLHLLHEKKWSITSIAAAVLNKRGVQTYCRFFKGASRKSRMGY